MKDDIPGRSAILWRRIPLRGAPHTAACLADKWDHPYSRELAGYPKGLVPGVHNGTVWPHDNSIVRRPCSLVTRTTRPRIRR